MYVYVLLFLMMFVSVKGDCISRAQDKFSPIDKKLTENSNIEHICNLIKTAVSSVKGPECSIVDDQVNKLLYFLQTVLIFYHVTCSLTDTQLPEPFVDFSGANAEIKKKYVFNIFGFLSVCVTTCVIVFCCYAQANKCMAHNLLMKDQRSDMCSKIVESVKCLNSQFCPMDETDERLLIFFIVKNPFEKKLSCDDSIYTNYDSPTTVRSDRSTKKNKKTNAGSKSSMTKVNFIKLGCVLFILFFIL